MGTLVLTFGSLLAVALWEGCRPRRRCRFPAALRRVSNISFWLFNTTCAALFFTAPDELRAPWPLPGWLSLIAGFLLMDLMIYTVHRTYHAVPVLWRLHALHHSDPDIDWSSAVRHHPAEYVSAGAVYWLATLAIGIPGPAVVFHALCVFAMAVATHGNVRWPARLEHLLQPVIITLDLHLVHHSVDLADANANFGAVLSVWDRLFSTLKTLPREAISGLSFGVCELDPREACRPTQMLLTPLRIGKMYSSTYAMPDDRAIEISAERRGKTLRLRSRLTKDGRVEFAHLRSYQGDAIERAVADFTSEFERITGLEALRLFPDNLWGQLR